MRRTAIAVLLILVVMAVAMVVSRIVSSRVREAQRAELDRGNSERLPGPIVVVRRYLEALEAKDYQSAYRYLSRDSQTKHPYDEFVSLNETKGITQYDLGTAREEQGEDGATTVTVQLREDPASVGIRVVKEGKDWKVVFIGGIPSYPYP